MAPGPFNNKQLNSNSAQIKLEVWQGRKCLEILEFGERGNRSEFAHSLPFCYAVINVAGEDRMAKNEESVGII